MNLETEPSGESGYKRLIDELDSEPTNFLLGSTIQDMTELYSRRSMADLASEEAAQESEGRVAKAWLSACTTDITQVTSMLGRVLELDKLHEDGFLAKALQNDKFQSDLQVISKRLKEQVDFLRQYQTPEENAQTEIGEGPNLAELLDATDTVLKTFNKVLNQ